VKVAESGIKGRQIWGYFTQVITFSAVIGHVTRQKPPSALAEKREEYSGVMISSFFFIVL
jgi:hypothetical protein